MGFLSTGFSRQAYGRQLAEQVAAVLLNGHWLAYGHRDYCGMGLGFDGAVFLYGEVWDGVPPAAGAPGVLVFSKREDFALWLANQSDLSLSRQDHAEDFYHGNQTVTRERLEDFVTLHEKHPLVTLPRWQRLWQELAARSDGSDWFGGVVAAWSEPHRHYHGLAHLNDCLALLDAHRGLAENPALVEAALWFHDVVYDTQSGIDNEEASALYARDSLESGGVDPARVRRVMDLILTTRRHDAGEDGDAALLCDVDLAVLGRPPAAFEAYDRAIRQEYAWVPERDYRQGRRQVLVRFLERTQIYRTQAFRAQFEQQARENLAAALQRLDRLD